MNESQGLKKWHWVVFAVVGALGLATGFAIGSVESGDGSNAWMEPLAMSAAAFGAVLLVYGRWRVRKRV